MIERAPMMYDFTDREAMLMRQAFHKLHNIGQRVTGEVNLAAVRRLEAASLVTSEATRGGIIIRPTSLGREAWINQGLRAAGRPLVRLPD